MERGCVCTSPFPAPRLNVLSPLPCLQRQAEAQDAEGMKQATQMIYPHSNHRLGNRKNLDDIGSEADEQSESRTMPQRPWLFFFLLLGCNWRRCGVSWREDGAMRVEQTGLLRSQQGPASWQFACRIRTKQQRKSSASGIHRPQSRRPRNRIPAPQPPEPWWPGRAGGA